MKKPFVLILVLFFALSLACNLSAFQKGKETEIHPGTSNNLSTPEITAQFATEIPQATIAVFIPTSQPTLEPTIAATVGETAEGTAEATQAPTSEPVSECQKYGIEEFDQPSTCWPSSLEEMKSITSLTTNPNEFAGVQNGMLEFKHMVADEIYLYSFNSANTYDEVTIEATFIKLDPSKNQNGATIACQVNDSGWYEVRVENSGSFYVYRYDADEKQKGGNPYKTLAQGGAPAVQSAAGMENIIRWTCKKDTLSLAVNGKEVWDQEERGMETGGGIGLGLVSSSGKYPLNIAFERVEISEPR